MKAKHLIGLVMAVTILSSCNNTEEWISGNSEEGTITASMDKNTAITRAGFTTSNGDFYWSQNDKLGVTTSKALNAFTPLTLTSTPGAASGTFKGNLLNGATIEGYAVYPYNENHSISTEGELTYLFPAAYTYNKVDADFATTQQGYGNSFNPAMWGKIDGSSVGMKHLGAVFCIKITSLPVGNNLQMVLSTDQKINGKYTANIKTDGTPVFVAENATNDTEKKVNITFSNDTENTSGVFYVPVPTGTYSNVRLKVLQGTDELKNVACGNYTLSRRDLRVLEITEGEITATESKTVEDANAVASALSGGAKSVAITNEVSDGTTIEIPTTTSSAEPVGLSLQSVADNATLTVEDKSGTSASVENLTLSIPNKEEGNAPSVKVVMPSTTVTLSSNAGEATYNEVTAETADETIIIENGVTVKKLIVKKGNVVLMPGAKVEAFERENSNKATVYVYAPESLTSLPDNFKYAGTPEVASLKKAMKKGGVYALKADVDITTITTVAFIIVPKDISSTLDLNGHTITASNNANIGVLGTLVLKDSKGNGKVVCAPNHQEGHGVFYLQGENASMTMNGGVIEATEGPVKNDDPGQYGVVLIEGADFTMTAGTIKANRFAVSGNGEDQTENCQINITGGELISTSDYAIYLPQSGKTTIAEGAKVIGAVGAVAQRSGTLEINGGSFISKGTGETGNGGDGTNNMSNSVINIGSGTANIYGNCNVTINGGTFTAEGSNTTVLAVQAAPNANKGTIKIAVNGGTFSDDTVLPYVTAESNVTILSNKD